MQQTDTITFITDQAIGVGGYGTGGRIVSVLYYTRAHFVYYLKCLYV